MITRSPLAHFVERPRDMQDRTRPVWGVCIHTTGRGIVDQARRHGADPLEYAAAYYSTPGNNGPHYVVGWDGMIIGIADEQERMAHCGIASERADYLSGRWVDRVPASLVTRWQERWKGVRSPAHLFPGPSANDAYAGIEMLPTVAGSGYPTRSGLRFTDMQHAAVMALVRDIAERWGFDLHMIGRLVGHEDVNPITRHDAGGGWDPGVLRRVPRFEWAWLLRG